MAFKNPITYLSQLIADVLTGALVQTASSGPRMWMQGQGSNTSFEGLFLSTGISNETTPATVTMSWDATTPLPQSTTTRSATVLIQAPAFSGSSSISSPASLKLKQGTGVTVGGVNQLYSIAALAADQITITQTSTSAALVIAGGPSAAQGSVNIEPDGSVMISPGANSATDAWQNATYAANFASYNTATYPPLQYRLDALGYVHLRGVVKATAATASGATIATLPAGSGFLPVTYGEIFTGNATVANAEIVVGTDGTIKLFTALSSGQYVSLSGITYKGGG